ncbi:hypothetical protein AAZX31_04G190700 [Glycine max]|uniref:Uncharacterized protein n=2 Tax=Glycine subgen. Soja TaxID=1462606 RepID=K7KLE4_SOYBN|nr:hypothetical protein JHK85_011217 [Glycine max]RZC17576.1 hypothetical protein D0Y65_010369 [Glycine soja]KAG5067176.1 hypothetical protein JHK86_010907 [Glycine max]KAH1112436.1 hypothetical protein GYH30_010615 [Glycine max]KAH1255337.1 hypothetical protein GmHk_04G011519 [Glycine max]
MHKQRTTKKKGKQVQVMDFSHTCSPNNRNCSVDVAEMEEVISRVKWKGTTDLKQNISLLSRNSREE